MFGTARLIVTGAIGTLASFGGFLASVLPQIEAGLRIASLLIGIAVGVVTLFKLQRNDRARGGSDRVR